MPPLFRALRVLALLALAPAACAASAGDEGATLLPPLRFLVVDADWRPLEAGAGDHAEDDADRPPDAIDGTDPFPGAVLEVVPGRALRVFAHDPRFRDPQRLLADPRGGYLLVDFAADPEGRGTAPGAVFRLDDRGAVIEALSPEAFEGPVGAAFAPDGRTLYVVDRRARPGRTGDVAGEATRGALFALDLATGECLVLARPDAFRAPADVRVDAEGRVLVLDADARAAPDDPAHRDDAPAGGAVEEGVLFVFDRTGRELERHALRGAISPLGLLPERDGTFLVFDVNADPLGVGGPLGAVFRLDPARGRTDVVASVLRFRDPVRGVHLPDGAVALVDANADPESRGPDPAGRGQNLTGPGALFRLDPTTGAVTLLAAPEGLVNPVDLLLVPEGGAGR